MIVVADTSPINYLVRLSQIELLQTLYKRIAIPVAVHAELQSPAAPVSVRQWAANLPPWMEVVPVQAILDPSLRSLDAGEREAIILAESVHAELIIIDESAARSIAERRGLRVIGTLGVLKEAAQLGLIDLEETIKRLRETNFRVSEDVLKSVLRDIG